MIFEEWWSDCVVLVHAVVPDSSVLDAVYAVAHQAWEASAKESAQQKRQPIATAPKDGTELLLCSRKGRIASGYWSGADHKNKTGFWVWPYINQEPVHWMPIPTAGAAQ